MAELIKPCPFCGGEAEIVEVRDNPPETIAIQCKSGCGVSVHHKWMEESVLVERWNTRVESTCTLHEEDGGDAVSDDFKATFCGAEYHNIDGIGWPDAVVMENQGSVLDGTYESRMYYPERTTRLIWDKHNGYWKCGNCGKWMKPDWSYCPCCGAEVVRR